MKKLGLIHIYTGDGKGKTTAAVGLATRALGSGFKVCYCSFHKDPAKYGYAEMESLKKLGATVLNFAIGHPHLDKSIDEEQIKKEVPEAIQTLRNKLAEESFDLLIMDEILISVRDRYLEESILLDFIKDKPQDTELVLTGRAATENVMALADYVTFCKKLKHPYDRKIRSRKGIEY
ncbi:MAG TPA: cob(I)yrinic acid a,c-diamide adenosyltransferase [Porphyromonadaceae bacterium]|jgi:cob(I)alamin adenosyltransferase|nr:cob(I)yrinic acid a,c-diamide adenosyltransferase [Porphyromonadaceae bacterium]HBL32749.1 cob(I)yrinic acid a,c-diamide adenosyltransferase [Porphyromonadaceae bacterium]HBX19786.1 cob(I)yrinic acid a,c-diamide adenosyltransferase [Porphyromonadaceae bacterium]HCM19423.1 cob(I)yrinic acid a,c-diamide adenosyltransferase [Porphyromonadaceae bacterium]